jgi:hypothetical protein
MAYEITTTWYNGYRCSCCEHRSTHSHWADTTEEALEELPTEFPLQTGDGGYISVKVRDGSTGKCVAESEVSWPPAYQRGDGYKFTIEGANSEPREETTMVDMDGNPVERPEPEPHKLKLITDRTWSNILSDLAEARRLRDIAKAEADKVDAEKRLASLRGSP